MTIQEYIEKINTRFKSGISTEHTFRGDLQNLLESIAPDVLITNEPTRIDCGSPDYIVTKRNIPIGYIEAKDMGADLDNKLYKEQFDRYKSSLTNLIITNYLEFRLFIDGTQVTVFSIAAIENGKLISQPDSFDAFSTLIKNFCTYTGQTIKSASKLSKMMAGKARLLADVIEKAINADEKQTENLTNEAANSSLREQMTAFKQILIHDINAKDFADIYAQTIAYGMFAARLHDQTLEDFSRQEAAELIPKTNPFLRKLFQYIAGYDLDTRIIWIVDALADIFRATNVAELLKDFGKATQQNDPTIHFYETFLSEYDPKLRKSRGVWYTPEPVVNFIVRAVDDILKMEFGLKEGLADTTKTKIKTKVLKFDERSKKKSKVIGEKIYEKEVHKVQILDPACGTGTFLAEVVKQIYKKFEGQQGIWSNYIENQIVPRLNGFELLMASYAMAHLKLDLLLTETGFKPTKEQRFKIFLTNSLEEYHPDIDTIFAGYLANEANEANHIKRDTPVMVVLGNPPYSGISSNNGEWISNLINDYKYIDGEYFNERKHWLNDDYVKFIRFGQHFIDKNGEGVLAFINNHSFLDNPTFRGMRWHLLNSFDTIYIIDLHGNSKKKEVCSDGSKDENVFDIIQGVSINLFVKTGKKKKGELAKVFHKDVWGIREVKYKYCMENDLKNIDFTEVKYEKPFLFFIPKNYETKFDFNKGFLINELFNANTSGIQTSRDFLVIESNKETLISRIKDFIDINKSDDEIRNIYFPQSTSNKYEKGDTRGWKISIIRPQLRKMSIESIIYQFSYRPFDKQYIAYSNLLIDWTREKVLKHLLKPNISITIGRQGQVAGAVSWNLVFLQDSISDLNLFYRGGGLVCPLYLYPEITAQQSAEQTAERTPNLKAEIVKQIAEKLGLAFTKEKETTVGTFAPIDILDYIYAVLYSPSYREKYKEFLKIDFPRIPYPENKENFWQLVKLGRELRQIHLLESPVVEKLITTYPESGTNDVTKIAYKDQKVWINDIQYFASVPQVAWEFYIGGYQPAQKWLKDRKGRMLSFDDILHYQKIVVALAETDRVMKEIDKVAIL